MKISPYKYGICDELTPCGLHFTIPINISSELTYVIDGCYKYMHVHCYEN